MSKDSVSSVLYSESSNTLDQCQSDPFNVWHNRLGHPSNSVVKSVMTICNVPHANKMNSSFCTSCCLGKIHNLSFPSSENDCKTPLQIVHTDLWGPASTPSINGYRYYIHFIDDYSKFTWIYMLTNKSKAFQTFCNFKSQVELQLGQKLDLYNQIGEVNIELLQSFYKNMVFITEYLCPGAHQQNGTAERKHRHIVETGLTLLVQASMALQ